MPSLPWRCSHSSAVAFCKSYHSWMYVVARILGLGPGKKRFRYALLSSERPSSPVSTHLRRLTTPSSHVCSRDVGSNLTKYTMTIMQWLDRER